jgi:hypothetical protein
MSSWLQVCAITSTKVHFHSGKFSTERKLYKMWLTDTNFPSEKYFEVENFQLLTMTFSEHFLSVEIFLEWKWAVREFEQDNEVRRRILDNSRCLWMLTITRCDNSRFLVVRFTWLARQWLLPRTCASTNSVLNVYLVFKIRFIKYRFLKSIFGLRTYTNNRLQRFIVPSVQSCFMPRHLRLMIYQLNDGIEYLGFGKVIRYEQKVSTQIARVPRTYVVLGWNQNEVPDRNIGVPPVHKYANYRTLP